MDLDFTQEQDILRETVRGLCARHSGLDVVRKLENDEHGFSTEFWGKFAESGLVGLTLPEKYDGSDMSLLDAVVVYEELGRSLAPSPHFVSSVLAGGALVRSANEALRDAWLPGIASGQKIVSVAWLEPDNGFGPKGVQLSAAKTADGWKLNGAKRHVQYAAAADAFIVLARAEEGPVVLLVDAASAGLALTRQQTIATDTQYRIDFTDVVVPASALVSDDFALWEETMLDGLILAGALAVGGSRRTLEITIDYANTRHQFDKPLGAFQSISHYLADASAAINGAELAVREAAWARDNGRPVTGLAPIAKQFACSTYREVTDMAVHVHGGMGFTMECDVQLYFRRAKSLQLNWYDDRHLQELIAADVLD